MSAKPVYKYNFVIVRLGGGYMVRNINIKPVAGSKKGHTHVEKFTTAISLVKLARNKEMPRNTSKHFIESLCRLSEDAEYIERLEDLAIDFKDLMTHGEIDVAKCNR